MAFSSIQNHNTFVLPAILLGCLLLLRALLLCRPGPSRQFAPNGLGPPVKTALLLSFLTALCMVPVFESYYAVYECSVSTRYYDEVLQTTRQTIAALSSGGVQYWLDYATLLAALRYQSINPWDHDADLSVLHPDFTRDSPQPWAVASRPVTESEASAPISPRLRALLDLLDAHNLHATYDTTRHLVQTRLSKGAPPHCDIWLWQSSLHPTTHEPYLWTADHTVHYNPRRWDEVMPLGNVSWIGVEGVSVPQDVHGISSKEFSVYGGSYLISAVFRGDCFHNFFNFRWMY